MASRLRGRLPERVAIHEISSDALAILDAWEGADRAILVDAVVSGAEPGTVHRWKGRDLPAASPFRMSSTHALGIVEVFRLGEMLERIPPDVEVIGIEAEQFEMGAPLSAPVEAAVAEVVEMLERELGGA